MTIAIIKYEGGNVQSVQNALSRLNAESVITNDPAIIKDADRIIFPGVGHAGNAMKYLRNTGLDILIPSLQQPVLGICLGMQLMCRHSEEGNTECLNIFNAGVKKFTGDHLKIPQIGWNSINDLSSPLFTNVSSDSFVYYVHSYFAEKCVETTAVTDYGLSYSAALQKDNFFGVQFHPEKSGETGELILKNFLKIKTY